MCAVEFERVMIVFSRSARCVAPMAWGSDAVRERLDCSEAFAKQVVRQKAQRRASTSLKTSPTEDDYAKPRVQLRATSKRQRGLPA